MAVILSAQSRNVQTAIWQRARRICKESVVILKLQTGNSKLRCGFVALAIAIAFSAKPTVVSGQAIFPLSPTQNNQSISTRQIFSKVTPGRDFSFPEDHNIHADFLTEWWYVTANLLGDDGLTYGAQFTLFRNILLVGSEPQPIFFAHAALTTPSEFFHAERFARADMGHGGVESEPWLAFLDHWQLKGTGKNPLPGSLSVTEKDFSYNLKLSTSPYFLQGDNGYSKKKPRWFSRFLLL